MGMTLRGRAETRQLSRPLTGLVSHGVTGSVRFRT
jgi:hypothetical protein